MWPPSDCVRNGGAGLGPLLFPPSKMESFAFEVTHNQVAVSDGLAPTCSPPLLVSPHLMSCVLRDVARSFSWSLDWTPEVCLFAAGLSNVPSLHSPGSAGYLNKGPTSLGWFCQPSLFHILCRGGLYRQPINCHKVNGSGSRGHRLRFLGMGFSADYHMSILWQSSWGVRRTILLTWIANRDQSSLPTYTYVLNALDANWSLSRSIRPWN